MQAADTVDMSLAVRPSQPGSVGRIATLITNFYEAKHAQMPTTLFHHDVMVYRTKWQPDEQHPEGGSLPFSCVLGTVFARKQP